MKKIVLVTRTSNCEVGFRKCKRKLETQFKKNSVINKYYVISNWKTDEKFKIGKLDYEIIFDKNPTRPTVFNKVLEKLNKNNDGEEYHLLAYSKEVDLRNKDIDRMIDEIEKNEDHLIVVGYRLRDKVLTLKKQLLYEKGIAYKVPWNTCALWNKKFVYGKGTKKLKFDEICEEDKNEFGELRVKINGYQVIASYKGMEDGLAIAELVSNNENLKYKLIDDNFPSWRIDCDEKRILSQKIKMARKSIVLAAFMSIRGYSKDKLLKARLRG